MIDRLEKFFNLKTMPFKFGMLSHLNAFLYHKLFADLLFNTNKNKKSLEYWFYFILLYIVSRAFIWFLILNVLFWTQQIDFLINFQIGILKIIYIRYFLEFIFYYFFFLLLSPISLFLVKVIHKHMLKKFLLQKGQINSENKFIFLDKIKLSEHKEYLLKLKKYKILWDEEFYKEENIPYSLIKFSTLYINYEYLRKYQRFLISKLLYLNSLESAGNNFELLYSKKFKIYYFIFQILQMLTCWIFYCFVNYYNIEWDIFVGYRKALLIPFYLILILFYTRNSLGLFSWLSNRIFINNL